MSLTTHNTVLYNDQRTIDDIPIIGMSERQDKSAVSNHETIQNQYEDQDEIPAHRRAKAGWPSPPFSQPAS